MFSVDNFYAFLNTDNYQQAIQIALVIRHTVLASLLNALMY
jgi:hypothetical protein